jgi:hypothetical protein
MSNCFYDLLITWSVLYIKSLKKECRHLVNMILCTFQPRHLIFNQDILYIYTYRLNRLFWEDSTTQSDCDVAVLCMLQLDYIMIWKDTKPVICKKSQLWNGDTTENLRLDYKNSASRPWTNNIIGPWSRRHLQDCHLQWNKTSPFHQGSQIIEWIIIRYGRFRT